MEEFEIKFLEVDVPDLEKKLTDLGAEKVGEYDYSRALFDYPDFRLNKEDAWLRLRTNGKETTLAYKKSIHEVSPEGGSSQVGMKEVEIVVDDYDKTYELLKSLGFVLKREEKNRRTRYQKNDIVYDIDFWPFVPPYLEIESDSFEKVRKAADELGFDGSKGSISSAGDVHMKYGIDADDYISMTFEGLVKR
jgi:adenylate cyclase class 2